MTTTDDRNNPCTVAALSGSQFRRRALGLQSFYDPHTKEELASTGSLELGIAIGGGVVGAAIWQLIWKAAPMGGAIGLVAGFIVVPTLVATLAWWCSLGAVRGLKFRRLSGIFLSRGRCPACSYQLTHQTPGPDGCVVCPECGAAWRADRLGQGDSPQSHGDTEKE